GPGRAVREARYAAAPARAGTRLVLPPVGAVLAARRPHPDGRLVGRPGGDAPEAGDPRLRRKAPAGRREARASAEEDRRGMGSGPGQGHPLLHQRRGALPEDPRTRAEDREDARPRRREQAPLGGRPPRPHLESDRLDPDPRRGPRASRGADDDVARRPRRDDGGREDRMRTGPYI